MISVEICIVFTILALYIPTTVSGTQSVFLSCDSDDSSSEFFVSQNVTVNLRSVNFPNSYQAPFVQCVRNFVGPVGLRLRLLFTTAYISPYLEFYDGSFNESNTLPLIRSISGPIMEREPKLAILSLSNKLAVVFKNISEPNTGFSAQIDALTIQPRNVFDYYNLCLFALDSWNLVEDGEKILTYGWHWEPSNLSGDIMIGCHRMINTNANYTIKLAVNFMDLGPQDNVTFLTSNGSLLTMFTAADNTNNASNGDRWKSRIIDGYQEIRVEMNFHVPVNNKLTGFSITASSYETPNAYATCPNANDYLLETNASVLLFNANADRNNLSYANNLRCNYGLIPSSSRWAVVVGLQKLQLERCCDFLSFKTSSSSSTQLTGDYLGYSTSSFPIRYMQFNAGESVAVEFNTDGNNGAQGFYAEAAVIDCECQNLTIVLNSSQPSATFQSPGYSKSSSTFGYCGNLNCTWKISAPFGYVLNFSVDGNLEFQSSDSLSITDGNSDYQLFKLTGQYLTESKVSISNSATASFYTDDHSVTYYNNVASGFTAFVKMEYDPSNQILHRLSAERPFHLIQSTDLIPPIRSSGSSTVWTVSAESGSLINQVQLFITFRNRFDVYFWIIDGSDRSGNVVLAFDQGRGFPTTNKAITSTSGSLTIFFEPGTNMQDTDLDFVFARVNTVSDRLFCSPSTMMYRTDRMTSAKQTVTLANTGSNNCAVALIGTGRDANVAMQFKIGDLIGSMALYGGVDFNSADHNEIIVFSQNDVITPLIVKGNVFVISLFVRSNIQFSFQPINPSTEPPSLGVGSRGVLMSQNFPLKNTVPVSEYYTFNSMYDEELEISLKIVNYDLGDNGILTIQAPESDFTQTIRDSGSDLPVTFCSRSFHVLYDSRGIQQKGFTLTYSAGGICSTHSLGVWFWIMIAILIIIAILAVIIMVLLCCAIRRKGGLRRREQMHVPPMAAPIYILAKPNGNFLPSAPPAYDQSVAHAPVQPNTMYPSLETE